MLCRFVDGRCIIANAVTAYDSTTKRARQIVTGLKNGKMDLVE